MNAGTDQKWTGLHLAAKEQNTGVVRVLLENKADGALRDSYGATALHYAVQLADLAHFNALHSSPRCVVKTADKKGVGTLNAWEKILHQCRILRQLLSSAACDELGVYKAGLVFPHQIFLCTLLRHPSSHIAHN